jgi:hypothetical protein
MCWDQVDRAYEARIATAKCDSERKVIRKAQKRGKLQCDRALVNCLQALPEDPRQWPNPPRVGTEEDSMEYRNWAIGYFN